MIHTGTPPPTHTHTHTHKHSHVHTQQALTCSASFERFCRMRSIGLLIAGVLGWTPTRVTAAAFCINGIDVDQALSIVEVITCEGQCYPYTKGYALAMVRPTCCYYYPHTSCQQSCTVELDGKCADDRTNTCSNSFFSNACPGGANNVCCTGKVTPTNADDCVGKNCGNGICKDGSNAHKCICNAGWEGDKCGTNTDECTFFD
jgi:hypothetical protein